MIKVMLKNFFIESRRMTAFQLFPVRGHILRIWAYIYGLVTSQIEIKPRDEPLMATLADKSDLMQAAHSEETGQKELQNIHLNLAHQYLQSETTKSIYGEKESEGLMIYVPIQQKGLVLDNTKKARFFVTNPKATCLLSSHLALLNRIKNQDLYVKYIQSTRFYLVLNYSLKLIHVWSGKF